MTINTAIRALAEVLGVTPSDLRGLSRAQQLKHLERMQARELRNV